MIQPQAILMLTLAILLTGCATDSSSHADNVSVDVPRQHGPEQLYAPPSSQPYSYRQYITDRAYDPADPNSPAYKNGLPQDGLVSQDSR